MKRFIPFLLALLVLSGCGSQSGGNDADYRQISTDEAFALMEEESNYIILDVLQT